MSLDCVQMEVTAGCRVFPDGSTQPVLIHTEYGKNAAGNVIVVSTRYTDAAGIPIALGAGEVVNPGCCSNPNVTITGGMMGDLIAGPARAATAAFSGAPAVWSSSVVPGRLQSITVSVKGVTDGFNPGATANQVIVTDPAGVKTPLLNGQTFTWSVERGQDQELRREFEFEATGMAYAIIGFTYA